MHLGIFTFNPFQENTYVLYDETGECVILDPGCSNVKEQKILDDFISSNELTPVRLINTHCHIDHILGNKYVSEKYKLGLEIHKGELETLKSGVLVGNAYGIPYEESPDPISFIEDGDKIVFGNTSLETLFTPGHSPASISFLNRETNILIAGDVLFRESIGRTDLPGGSTDTLLKSIKERLFTLPDETQVFSGHGPKTTIGHERVNNPFLRN
ncbi:MBL fold metallo-hydrolase [Portibacter lacus]|uniref:MBL fold hydrolase n=1 Tax=Portibacter lacus TaxID=1099794 RepID=A0AA37WFM8_9BACT|nr:MBL fold metallo-hydrolase [Portibacter lacus]GLR18943.1 MBL fold hydrolase [Portibacter lacus]